jgi:hypothetical protein
MTTDMTTNWSTVSRLNLALNAIELSDYWSIRPELSDKDVMAHRCLPEDNHILGHVLESGLTAGSGLVLFAGQARYMDKAPGKPSAMAYFRMNEEQYEYIFDYASYKESTGTPQLKAEIIERLRVQIEAEKLKQALRVYDGETSDESMA